MQASGVCSCCLRSRKCYHGISRTGHISHPSSGADTLRSVYEDSTVPNHRKTFELLAEATRVGKRCFLLDESAWHHTIVGKDSQLLHPQAGLPRCRNS